MGIRGIEGKTAHNISIPIDNTLNSVVLQGMDSISSSSIFSSIKGRPSRDSNSHDSSWEELEYKEFM